MNNILIDYINSIKDYKIYSADEEIRIFNEYKTNPTIEKKNEIFNHNAFLVIKEAKRYYNMCVCTGKLDIMDLVVEGNIGLLIAIDKFDTTLGYKFSTYAIQWIREKIYDYYYKEINEFSVPISQIRKKQKLNKAIKLVCPNEDITTLSKEQITKITGISDYSLSMLLDIPKTSNIDETINTENGEKITYADTLLTYDDYSDYEKSENVKEENFWNVVRTEILKACELKYNSKTRIKTTEATDRIISVLKNRFGFNEEQRELTLNEIADAYGLTRERVRQIEAQGLNYLKSSEIMREIKEEVLIN